MQSGDEDAGREAERGELPTESRDAAGEVVGADMDSRDELPEGEEAERARPRARRRVSATRRAFSSMPKKFPAATRARTGIDPRRSVDRRSRIRLLAVGRIARRLLHYLGTPSQDL